MTPSFKPHTIAAIEFFSYFQHGLSWHGLSDTIGLKNESLGSMVTDCIPLMKLAFHSLRGLSEENQLFNYVVWIKCCSEVVQKGDGAGEPLILRSPNCTQSLLLLTLILHSQTINNYSSASNKENHASAWRKHLNMRSCSETHLQNIEHFLLLKRFLLSLNENLLL